MPKAIIVEFPEYTGDCLIPEYPDRKLIPIVPFEAHWVERGESRSRLNFPIRLSWAMTIHKSQGLTMDAAVIDIGKQDIGTGSTYVALSRLRSLQGCYFNAVSFDRLEQINDNTLLRMRQRAESKLEQQET